MAHRKTKLAFKHLLAASVVLSGLLVGVSAKAQDAITLESIGAVRMIRPPDASAIDRKLSSDEIQSAMSVEVELRREHAKD